MAETAQDTSQYLDEIFKTSQTLMQQLSGGLITNLPEPPAAAQSAEAMKAAFDAMAEWQKTYVEQMTRLWTAGWGFPGVMETPESRPDKRFSAEAWTGPGYDVVRRTYLAYSELLQKSVDVVAANDKTKGQLRFVVQQMIDALSPANFLATNPDALKMAAETGGKSLVEGTERFFQDLAKGQITITDESRFKVGENIAVTEGSVVFENDLIQLIQYTAKTKEVAQRPLVLVPPCINKFYILDLQPENSFAAYCVEEGITVFMVSWRNITADMASFTWDDYLQQGVLKAIEVARDICGVEQVNTLGFCIGGVLLSSALAVERANGRMPASSMTLLTTMLDYTDTGEIGLLVSEQGVAKREMEIGKGGVMHGKELAFVFSSLRSNDLIWPYVVNSYLKGQAPPAFDLLYWNADATNLPGPMFCWYVRNTYLENNLRQPGKTIQCGVPVDLGEIAIPSYLYASREDHIVPWQTAYTSTQILSGERRFTLGASGHIAGVVNPSKKKKRNYWTGGMGGVEADAWLTSAESVPGSWWPDWSAWLAGFGGKQVPARKVGNKNYKAIEPAPGRYVMQKAE
jgi:polyhydroxyalkanoate synthase